MTIKTLHHAPLPERRDQDLNDPLDLMGAVQRDSQLIAKEVSRAARALSAAERKTSFLLARNSALRLDYNLQKLLKDYA
jgi:hypothetical protein